PDVHAIVLSELGNARLHQTRPLAVPRADLHVVHLPHEIARRASRDAWHRTEALQLGAVSGGARLGLSAAAVARQRFAALDAANRRVRDEPGARVAKNLGALGILGRFDDPRADRLLLAALDRDPDAAAAHHLRHGAR